MSFKTVQEAFNYYRTATAGELEARAAAIKTEVQSNANADIDALNIELDGLKQAKINLEERSARTPLFEMPRTPSIDTPRPPTTGTERPISSGFNPVTGMSFSGGAPSGGGDIFASAEYRSAFNKTMLNQPLSSEEAAIFQSANQLLAAEKRAAFINASEATAVIPTQMLNEIYKHATDMGGVLPLCRRFDVPSNLAVPVATPEDAAEWHTEGAEVTPDNKKPSSVLFDGNELMKVFSISAKARTMSLSAYESYLQQELSRVMVTALEKSVIEGTGSNQPLGLLADGVITNTLEDMTAEYKTFTRAAAMLRRGYRMGAVWAMNDTTLYNDIMGIVDATGKPMFNEAKDGNADRILGKPIVIDDFIPDGTIIFGNFYYYGVNYPQDILY